jgi:hypothetical protein
MVDSFPNPQPHEKLLPPSEDLILFLGGFFFDTESFFGSPCVENSIFAFDGYNDPICYWNCTPIFEFETRL